MEQSTKFFILQSVRELLVKQEQEEKEALCCKKKKSSSLPHSLQRVQRKLKEQLLEEKRIAEKKLGTARAVLKAALKRREEVAQRLNALLKKRAAQNTRLSKVSDALEAASTSRAKVNQLHRNIATTTKTTKTYNNRSNVHEFLNFKASYFLKLNQFIVCN